MNSAFIPVRLGQILQKSEDWVEIEPQKKYKQVTIKMWGQGVALRQEVSGAEIAASRQLLVHQNQFILSRIDARNGAFGLVPSDLEGAAVSNDFPAFNVNTDKLYPKYLGWLSKTSNFVDLCKSASEGTTNRVRLKEDRFLALEIPLPPLEEQRRIVARIEALATKIEEIQRLRCQVAEEEAILEKLLLDSALQSIEVDGCLGEVLLEKPRNGWSARCDNLSNGIPVLSLSAVTGFQYKPQEYKRTSEITELDAHYWLNKGDLLITRSNAPHLVGHAAIYDGSPEPCIYPDLMMRLLIDEERVDKKFVLSWLKSSLVRSYIISSAKGTSPTMKKISQGTVINIPFPISLSLEKQRNLAQKMSFLELKIQHARSIREEASKCLDVLLPSILDKAFKGEL